MAKGKGQSRWGPLKMLRDAPEMKDLRAYLSSLTYDELKNSLSADVHDVVVSTHDYDHQSFGNQFQFLKKKILGKRK